MRWMLKLICPLCLRCGSLFVEKNCFCPRCAAEFLVPIASLKKRMLDFKKRNYVVHYLIRWRPYQSDCLSELIYILKSRWSFPVWIEYTKKISISSICGQDFHETIIIPVPSRRPQAKAFHTHYLSQALCAQSSFLAVDCLILDTSMTAQKNLGRIARTEIHAQVREEFTGLLKTARQIILVDDIITTGSTFKACLSALKAHLSDDCQVKIIALFSREKI